MIYRVAIAVELETATEPEARRLVRQAMRVGMAHVLSVAAASYKYGLEEPEAEPLEAEAAK